MTTAERDPNSTAAEHEQSPKKPLLVTVTDQDTGESVERELLDDVMVLTDGTCWISGIADYPGTGTQVITVKGRKGLGVTR